MNTDNIRKLLDKFYNGETDAAEERILEDFFRRDEVPSGLKWTGRYSFSWHL